MNLSGIRATEFNVVVQLVKVDEVSKGGVIIPDIARERQEVAAVEGIIVHASPLAFSYERWPDNGEGPPKVGDRVLFAKFSGMARTGKDGQQYRLIKDKDVAGILD